MCYYLQEEILEETNKYVGMGSWDWQAGRVSGAVYNYNQELVTLASEVYGRCAWTNPLHHDVFPGIHKMEAEVVRMVCSMYNGGPETCGVVGSVLFQCLLSLNFPFIYFASIIVIKR